MSTLKVNLSCLLGDQGCTRGRHNDEKPEEPLRPEVSSDKGGAKVTNGEEIIYRGPKSAEALQRERPRYVTVVTDNAQVRHHGYRGPGTLP